MTKQISILFLASAALHAAVLGLIDFDSSKAVFAGSPFRVSIQAASPAGAGSPGEKLAKEQPLVKQDPVSTKRNLEKSQDKNPASVSKRQRDVTESIEQTSIALSNNPVTVKTTLQEKPGTPSSIANSANPSQSVEIFYLTPETASLLQADLNKAFSLHFYYPRLAIKRGWQGEVRLGLRIEADGHLSRIKILKTSGHALLDNEAIKSLSKVEILPEAVAILNGQSTDLILPVEYRLL